MKGGIGSLILKIGVIVYLAVNGIFAFLGQGDFQIIFSRLGISGTFLTVCVIVFGILALLAALGTLLEMFGIKYKILNTLLFVVAIIWAVYIVVQIISWITHGFGDPLGYLQKFAVHTIVFATLLIESEKFN